MPVIGVDLGATSIKAGLVDGSGRILERARLDTRGEEGPDAVLDRVAAVVGLLGGRAVASRIGIGSCGLVDARGRVLETTDTMPGWKGTDIPVEIAVRCGLPCTADNDGNAAALGEALLGAGRGRERVAMLTLGTGVGGGLVVEGRIVHGAGSMAASFGHLKVAAGGPRCACGARGCLEAYASAWALRREAGIDAHEVFARAADGDPACRRLVRRAGRALGTALADIAHAVNPDVVVIGGGLSRSWSQLEATVRRRYTEAALPAAARSTGIAVATLGDDAGLVGAALL